MELLWYAKTWVSFGIYEYLHLEKAFCLLRTGVTYCYVECTLDEALASQAEFFPKFVPSRGEPFTPLKQHKL